MSRPKPSSAANGRLSHGPTTQAGKDRSRFNAVTHGLTAHRHVLLKNESAETFHKLVIAFKQTFLPETIADDSLVETMIVNEWRLRRAQSMETSLMQDALDAADPERNPAEALCEVMESKSFTTLARYQATLQNAFHRSVRTLAFFKKNFPDAIPGSHPADLERAAEPAAPQAQPAPPPVPEPHQEPRTFYAKATAGPVPLDATAHPAAGPAAHTVFRRAAA